MNTEIRSVAETETQNRGLVYGGTLGTSGQRPYAGSHIVSVNPEAR